MTGKIFETLSDFKSRKVRWFWEPYIPYEMITILEGDPGTGKSFIGMFLAAIVSKGGTLPSGERLEPGNVLYISAEDDPEYTTRPRIEAMKGDLSRIRVLNSPLVFDDAGLDQLIEELESFEPDLIIVDPLVSFIPSDIKMKDSNAIRIFLAKLGSICRAYGCALILNRHLTKTKHDNTLYQGGGTMDLIAVARSVLRVGQHPNEPEDKVMAHIKHNVGPKGPSWLYRLQASQKVGGLPRLKFIEETDITAEEMSNAIGKERLRPIEVAEEFLKRELSNGRRLALELKELAKKEGISPRTLDRAKEQLDVKTNQSKRKWYWCMPD